MDGRGVITYKKPDVGIIHPVKRLPTSDDFRGTTLGMQWGWNHNPDPENWSLTQRPGHLRLRTGKVVDSLTEAPNMLTQRPFAHYDHDIPTIGTTKLEVSGMKEGDVAGLAVFQDPYAYIAIKQEKGSRNLMMVNNGALIASVPAGPDTIYLRAILSNRTEEASFEYSYDNKEYRQIGNMLAMRFSLTVFTGNKFGLFNFSTEEPGGYVDFDWFTMD
jgi:beta-xylosidase